jgi:hypothetical protein
MGNTVISIADYGFRIADFPPKAQRAQRVAPGFLRFFAANVFIQSP